MQSREERIARNDSTFRDANEKIAAAAGKYELVEKVPFICECATESCTLIVRLSLAEIGHSGGAETPPSMGVRMKRETGN